MFFVEFWDLLAFGEFHSGYPAIRCSKRSSFSFHLEKGEAMGTKRGGRGRPEFPRHGTQRAQTPPATGKRRETATGEERKGEEGQSNSARVYSVSFLLILGLFGIVRECKSPIRGQRAGYGSEGRLAD